MKSVSFDESGSHPASSNQFENAYSATKGWDFATGVGTLNADAPRIFISNADGSAERPLTEPGSMAFLVSEGRLDRVHIGARRIS